jgi:hypothetical protein
MCWLCSPRHLKYRNNEDPLFNQALSDTGTDGVSQHETNLIVKELPRTMHLWFRTCSIKVTLDSIDSAAIISNHRTTGKNC